MKPSIDSGEILFPGLRILDRYELSEPIARGGMAWVWRAEHLALGCSVAIKFTLRNDDEAARRFLQEARTVATLSSPHIVHVFDVGLFEGQPFLVMELLRGETLEERLLARARLRATETVAILSQVARGIEVAHDAGVIHRDLKPSNIFLVKNGELEVAKVLDFGVSRDVVSRGTQPGEFVGTPHYISPEQAADPSKVDARSDYWSLAVIAFECVLGKRPFRGESMPQLINEICNKALPVPSQEGAVPPGFDSWFAKAAFKEPSQRFQSAGEFRESLALALCEGEGANVAPHSHVSTGARSGDPTERVETRLFQPPRRTQRYKLAIVAVISLLAAVLWWSWRAPLVPTHSAPERELVPGTKVSPPSNKEPAAFTLEPPSPEDSALSTESPRPAARRPSPPLESGAGDDQGARVPDALAPPRDKVSRPSSKVPVSSPAPPSGDEELWRHRK